VANLDRLADERDTIRHVLNSAANAEMAWAAHFVAKNPDGPGRNIFIPGPRSYVFSGTPAIAFQIVTREVSDGRGGTVPIGAPEFDSTTAHPSVSADSLAAALWRVIPSRLAKRDTRTSPEPRGS